MGLNLIVHFIPYSHDVDILASIFLHSSHRTKGSNRRCYHIVNKYFVPVLFLPWEGVELVSFE